MIKYFNGGGEYLNLSDDDLKVIKLYVDACFEFRPDFKSHTGAIVAMHQGVMQ